MIRIAHLADLHLGFNLLNRTTATGQNQREADFQAAAMAVCDYLVKDKPDVVVIAGDLLHKTSPTLTGLDGASEFCSRLTEAGIQILAIGGNHDEAESVGRFNGLRYLARHGLEVSLEQTFVEASGVRFHMVPFRVLSRAARKRGELKSFEFSTQLPNVLVAHGYAPGNGVPKLPVGADTEIPADWITDPRFDLICLGHIHAHTELSPRAFYPGSLERRDFGESEQRPGFYIHTLDPELVDSQSVFVDEISDLPRPMINIEIDTSNLTVNELNDKVLEIIREPGLEDAMLRLVLLNVSAELDRSRSRVMWERVFRERGGFYLDAVTQTRRVVELLDVKFAAPPLDLAEAFHQFLSEQQFASQEEKDKMLDLGAEIMADAHADLLKQEGD